MQRSEGRLIETFGPVEGRRTLRRYGTAIHCRGVKVGVVLLAAEVDGVGGTMPSWSEVRSFALAAEDRGFDSVWMFDHVFNRPDDGAAEGMYESWTILSALARSPSGSRSGRS